MSQSELQAAESSYIDGPGFEVIHRRRRDAERQLEPSWTLDCPICRNIETFVVQLDEGKLASGVVVPARGICVKCDLRMPPPCRTLLQLLCGEQINQARENILSDYGIA
jgi:hypothetical protein